MRQALRFTAPGIVVAIAALAVLSTDRVFSPTVDAPPPIAAGPQWLSTVEYTYDLPHPPLMNKLMYGLTQIMNGGFGWVLGLICVALLDGKRGRQALLQTTPPLWFATMTVEYPIKYYFRRRRPFIDIVQAIAPEDLDIVLQLGYVETQKDVHVETGSLKSSGKVGSEVSKIESKWEGTIRYGGPSTGVNNPVDYAIYEKRRGIGGAGGPSDAKGDHDFFGSLPSLHKKYIEAIQIGLKG